MKTTFSKPSLISHSTGSTLWSSPGRFSRPLVRSLILCLTIALLGGSAVFAEKNEEFTNTVISSAPLVELFSKHESPTQSDQAQSPHLKPIQNILQQFLHWQYLLRLFMGFTLAVPYRWFIS